MTLFIRITITHRDKIRPKMNAASASRREAGIIAQGKRSAALGKIRKQPRVP